MKEEQDPTLHRWQTGYVFKDGKKHITCLKCEKTIPTAQFTTTAPCKGQEIAQLSAAGKQALEGLGGRDQQLEVKKQTYNQKSAKNKHLRMHTWISGLHQDQNQRNVLECTKCGCKHLAIDLRAIERLDSLRICDPNKPGKDNTAFAEYRMEQAAIRSKESNKERPNRRRGLQI